MKSSKTNNSLPKNPPQQMPAGRLASIDALRGFDMFWITGGATLLASTAKVWENPVTSTIELQLQHADWIGFHFLDLVYPLFLFLIGVVLPFSLARRTERDSGRTIHLHFLKRSLMLILLGSIARGVFTFTKGPFLGGVLEHIGITYFFAAPLVMHTRWQTRAILLSSFLALYGLALLTIPVPGYGAGVFTEEGNLATYIDRHFINGDLWNEGPTSTLSCIAVVVWGSLAGGWLHSGRFSGNQKAMGLALLGLTSLTLGYSWSYSLPMIKRILWTSSYVMFACGWSLLFLAVFYWLIDVKGYRKWAYPFIVIGTNAITIFFLQKVINFGNPARLLFGGIALHSGALEPLVLALGIVVVKWLFLWLLYRNRVFFKL